MLEIISFSLFYSFTFALFLKIFTPLKSLKMHNRDKLVSFCTAIIHSLLCLSLSLYSHVNTSGTSFFLPTTPLQYLITCVNSIQNTIGYLIYDLIIGSVFKVLDTAMVLHHVCSIISGLIMLSEQNSGSVTIITILLTENTSPFYQLKNIFKLLDMRNSIYCQINEMIFAALFVISRPFLLWILLFNILKSDFNITIKLSTILVYCLGLIWSYTVVCIVKARLVGKVETWLERIKNHKLMCMIFVSGVSIILPYVLNHRFGVDYIHIKYGDFIVI